MTRISFCYALLMLWGLPGSTSDLNESSVLTVQASEKIRILADERSYLMDVFLPEQTDTVKVPLASVPDRVRVDAAAWIGRVVQQRWLPADMDKRFTALKDVKQWEKRDNNGILISERVGDFLTLDFEVSGYGIHVQEAGGELSLRVDLQQPVAIADDPADFVRKCLTDFLNLSEAVVAQLQGDVKEESPLYWAYLRSPRAVEKHLALLRTQRVTLADRERWMKERQWWDRVYVCTDGHFFFVRVAEAEPVTQGRYNPRAKGGLPDRF